MNINEIQQWIGKRKRDLLKTILIYVHIFVFLFFLEHSIIDQKIDSKSQNKKW